jgi:hypothetical protein
MQTYLILMILLAVGAWLLTEAGDRPLSGERLTAKATSKAAP